MGSRQYTEAELKKVNEENNREYSGLNTDDQSAQGDHPTPGASATPSRIPPIGDHREIKDSYV